MLHVPPLPWIVEPREPPGTCGPRSAGRSHPCSGGCWGRSPTPPAPSPLPGRASPTEVLHRDKTLIRQRRLDEPRDALEDHEVPGGLVELGHCVRVHSGNLLGRCHQLIRRRRHGVGGRDFRLQDKGSSSPLEPKWWPKWILIKSQDKRPPAVNALAQTLQSTTLVQQKEPYSQNGASFMPQ